MWIYMKDGFFSVIEHPDSKKHVLVRARVKGDIEKVFGNCTTGSVQFTPDSDYRFRAAVSKAKFGSVLLSQSQLINYKNFKNAINDKERREYWYEQVWDTMVMMQDNLATMDEALEATKTAQKV